MPVLSKLAAVLILVSCAWATAAEPPSEPPGAVALRVTSVIGKQLSLFSRPDAASKTGDVAKERVTVPTPILDRDDDERFFKIEIDHQFVWVKSAQVHAERGVAVGCLAQEQTKVTASAVRGANEGCKK